jgi:hypothetical protein
MCGVFLPRLLVQFEIGTQESSSQLGNELFAAITIIASALADAKETGARRWRRIVGNPSIRPNGSELRGRKEMSSVISY